MTVSAIVAAGAALTGAAAPAHAAFAPLGAGAISFSFNFCLGGGPSRPPPWALSPMPAPPPYPPRTPWAPPPPGWPPPQSFGYPPYAPYVPYPPPVPRPGYGN